MTPDSTAPVRAVGLDDFADWVEPARPGERCQDIYRRFSADPDLLSVPVVDGGVPLGLVHRSEFMMRLAHNFGRALYGKKAITALMDRDPLTVDRTIALETVQSTIAGSRPCALVNGFIITDGGRYVALGTALSLIRHSLARAEERAAELAAALNVARSADAAKSTFLATMSHELRTPLNAVIGFSDLIVERTLGELDEGYVDYARNIREGGEHLLSIVTSVLDYAKTERSEIELRDEIVDLEAAAMKTARAMAPQAAQRQVELVARVAARPCLVRADLRLTRQILFNLVSNAVKFTPPQGRVELSAGCLADGRFFLSVADSGCGMTADEVAVAMQPFRQVDNGLTRRHEGTGLGLPLVKAFIEAHGGVLALTSVPGRGTTATITFPLTRAAGRQDHADAA